MCRNFLDRTLPEKGQLHRDLGQAGISSKSQRLPYKSSKTATQP